MNSIEGLIERLCPDGVEYKALGDVGVFLRGTSFQKKHFVDEGIPCVHYGQLYTYYRLCAYETKSFLGEDFANAKGLARPGDLIIATTSENEEDVCKAMAWLGVTNVVVSNDAYIYRHALNPKYVAYFFQSSLFQDAKKQYITGTKVLRVSGANMAKINIPVPPMEVQEEIVRVLDSFAELEAELEARKRQYAYYRRHLFAAAEASSSMMTLADVSLKVCSGGTPSKNHDEYYGGVVPWLRTQEVDFCDVYDTGIKITEAGLANSSAKMIPENCVIVAMYGATAGKAAVNKIPLCTNQACCNLEINPSVALYRYVYHWVCNEYENIKALGQGSQSNISGATVKGYSIPVPSLETQGRIVDALDQFDALASDISEGLPAEIVARRKQYAYYRDKLLNFKEKVA